MPTRGFKHDRPTGNEHKGSYARQSIKLRSKVKAPPSKPHKDKTKYNRKGKYE